MKTVLFVLLSANCLFGRIGETPEECEKRYGVNIAVDMAPEHKIFNQGDFIIYVTILDEKCARIRYQHKESQPLTDAQIELLLKKNSSDGKWTDLGNGKAFDWAHFDQFLWAKYDKTRCELDILTTSFLGELDKRTKKSAEESVKGL